MASSGAPTPKKNYWLVALSLLSVAVLIVMGMLAYLLLTWPEPVKQAAPTNQPQGLSLPTAPPSTATPGPPMPLKESFIAEEPIKGFSDCNVFGFQGVIKAGNGNPMAGIQVVIWADQGGLLALGTSDKSGNYRIELQEKPVQPQLWAQLYQGDIAVSAPVPVTPHLDCHNGFQVFQINWRELPQERNK